MVFINGWAGTTLMKTCRSIEIYKEERDDLPLCCNSGHFDIDFNFLVYILLLFILHFIYTIIIAFSETVIAEDIFNARFSIHC